MSDLTVANTILDQMGGSGKLIAMIGAKNFVGSDNALSFMFVRAPRKAINRVRIELLPNDDGYKVTFYKGKRADVVMTFETIPENLRESFEHHTGLRISL
jgi:hypothetical protein